MSIVIVLFGIALAGFGVVMIMAPDLMWGWQERRNEARGQLSERTERWDRANNISGVVAIVTGLVVAVLGLGFK